MPLTEDRWTIAAFRIISKNLSIENICDIINISPTRYISKGESLSKRNPNSKISETSVWILDSELSDQEPIESHIKHFLALFKEKERAIKTLHNNCEFDIMCAYSSENGQGGFTLEHELLKKLTSYPVDLIVNLYPPESKE